ncbi:MAG: hypothetical protein ACSHYF_10825 [Verrucomicrobiaceae bacterium]
MRTFLLSLIISWAPLQGIEIPQIISPSQLATFDKEHLHNNSTTFTIRFEVHAVRKTPTIFADGTRHQVLHLIPGDDFPGNDSFTVPLSRKVETRLKHLGIANIADHFTGKTVTVKGVISNTGLHLIGSPTIFTHHIAIRSMDQILSITGGIPETD